MGLDAQSIMFTSDFIEPLVKAGYYVIRFDNRDIGLSTWLNDSWHRKRPYTLEDMAKDTIDLMDYLSIAQAHVIGVSMGGMIAQRLAISYAERVLCLVSIMSSGFILDPQALSFFRGRPFVNLIPFFLRNFPIKSKLVFPPITVENYVKTYRRLNGKTFPFNYGHFNNIFSEGIEKRKGQNPRARFQQFCGIAASGSRLHELPKIKAPTLVIHGTEDPLIPPIHATIYAPKIPNSKMLWVEGMGHQLPGPVLETVMPAIIQHFKTNAFDSTN